MRRLAALLIVCSLALAGCGYFGSGYIGETPTDTSMVIARF